MITRVVNGESMAVMDEHDDVIFSLRESIDGQRAAIEVCGRITLEASHEFSDELTSLATVCQDIVVDFSDTSFLSSTALESLLQTQRLLDRRSVDSSLKLRGLKGELLDQFCNTGFIELFDIEGI